MCTNFTDNNLMTAESPNISLGSAKKKKNINISVTVENVPTSRDSGEIYKGIIVYDSTFFYCLHSYVTLFV